MKKEIVTFLSANKQTQIHAIRWLPEGEIVAILQIAHGMVEYIDRYHYFAEFLNQNGILVVGHDHLGHGESVHSEDEWGFFAEGDASKILIDDMYKLTQLTKKEYPGIPYFVLGHSMGSFITRYYLSYYSKEIDGVILSGTGQNSKIELMFGKMLTKVLAVFKGNTYRSTLVDKLAFGGMNKGIENARTEKDWLSRDEHQVDLYLNEPRCQFIFTLNGYYHLFDICKRVQENEVVNQVSKELPMLMVAGDRDSVGENGKMVLKVYEEYKKAGIKDIECILYPEYRHEILNEIDNQKVYEDILDWIWKHKN